jgi:exonuclease III
VEQAIPKMVTKRKHVDNADPSPQKKLQVESDNAAAKVEKAPQELLEMVAENIGTYRIVRAMAEEYTLWTERLQGLSTDAGRCDTQLKNSKL